MSKRHIEFDGITEEDVAKVVRCLLLNSITKATPAEIFDSEEIGNYISRKLNEFHGKTVSFTFDVSVDNTLKTYKGEIQ